MGVDIAQYDNVESQKIIYDAVFIGRFHEQKGIERLLHSWKIVNDKQSRLLCIIGGGSAAYLNSINNLVKDLNIAGAVEILGFLDGTEKIRVMKSSRISVVPSIYESYGAVVSEAGACRLPVVAFSIPIFEDLFHKHILLTENNNINEYACNIIAALTTDQSLRVNDFRSFCFSLDWSQVLKAELEELNG
jgi:glycosyltransferase involved in cell wall biosynthesis